MEVVKTIVVTREDILNHFISLVEDCTIAEASKVSKIANIEYDLEEKENRLTKIIITYDEGAIHS